MTTNDLMTKSPAAHMTAETRRVNLGGVRLQSPTDVANEVRAFLARR